MFDDAILPEIEPDLDDSIVPEPIEEEGEVYFAREAPYSDEFAAALEERINRFYDHLNLSGRLVRWRRGIRMLNGMDGRGGAVNSAGITLGGDQGELVQLKVNLFRSFIRSMHTYVTGSRPAMQPRAIAVDAQTTNRTSLAFSLMDYYLSKGNVEKTASEAALYSMPFGDTWTDVRWDARPAMPYMMDDGDSPTSGDVRVYMRTADNVIRDIDAPDIDSLQWVIVRSKVPRWDLIAQYPQRKDLILNAKQKQSWRSMDGTTLASRDRTDDERRDFVTIFEFFHVPCAALPEGRMATYIGGEILDDGPNIYGELPTIPMAPSSEIGCPFGYGETWDLMAIQEAYDSVWTQLVTTQENFGLKNIFVHINSNLNVSMIGSGLRMLQGMQPPEVVDLEGGGVDGAARALELLRDAGQMLTGLNDVALGDASKSQSGAALAMLHSLTVQFHSGMQREYSSMLERTMYAVLKRLRKFATEPRMVQIVGKNKAPASRDFIGKDLDGIVGIDVELANPVMRTTAGRVQVMKDLLDAQMITSPEQYLEGISTGRLDPIEQYSLSQRELLEKENEQMINGKYPPVLLTDDHAFHIREHVVLLNDPLTRMDPSISDVVLAHIQSHLNFGKGVDPVLTQALGLQPLAPPPPPGMELEPSPQGAPEQPPPPGNTPAAPPPGPGASPGMPQGPGGGVNPGGAPAQSMPSMPSAPAVPLPAG